MEDVSAELYGSSDDGVPAELTQLEMRIVSEIVLAVAAGSTMTDASNAYLADHPEHKPVIVAMLKRWLEVMQD